MNLAVNARDAMPTGGTLTHRDRQRRRSTTHTRTPHPEARPGEYVMLSRQRHRCAA